MLATRLLNLAKYQLSIRSFAVTKIAKGSPQNQKIRYQMKKFTLNQFQQEFPTNDSCLERIFKVNYPNLKKCPSCKKESKFTRVSNRRCYQCSKCRYQIYPTAGTIFEKTKVSLKSVFTIIYYHTTTRNGISAKEVERLLDVSYKTALRLCHLIKELMSDKIDRQLMDYVMADESYFGMKARNMHSKQRKMFKEGRTNKTTVMGFIDKEGTVITKVLGQETLPAAQYKEIVEHVVHPDAVLITDAFPAYKNLHFTFPNHIRVDHSRGEYVKDGHGTNKIENYWSTLKRMIKGTHIHVSPKHLPKYVGENTFRFVRRNEPEKMFYTIIERIRI